MKFLQKITPKGLRRKALNFFGVEQEDLEIAQNFKSYNESKKFCMNYLAITDEDLTLIQQLKEMGPMEYAMRVLDIPKIEVLKEFKAWIGKSKAEKIEELADNVDHIRDFNNLTYIHYKREKKKNKAAWKKYGPKHHLLEIQSIVNRAIVEDSISLNDMKEVSMRAFMAFWCAVNQFGKQEINKEMKNVVIQLVPKEQEVSKAA